MNHSNCCHGGSSGSRKFVPLLIGLAVLGVAIAVWLGYGAALLKFLPLLLFAACPLMHLFMHRHGEGHHPTETKTVEVKALPARRQG